MYNIYGIYVFSIDDSPCDDVMFFRERSNVTEQC